VEKNSSGMGPSKRKIKRSEMGVSKREKKLSEMKCYDIWKKI
jgi:hypothetical protein